MMDSQKMESQEKREVKREPLAVASKPHAVYHRVFGGSVSSSSIREKLEPSIPNHLRLLYSICKLMMALVFQVLRLIDSDIVPVSASQVLPTGTCVLVQGVLEKPSTHGKQTIELKVEKVLYIGTVESDTYPLSRKKIPLDSLRDFSHIRPRTTTVASVSRIRSALDIAIHTFFQNHSFYMCKFRAEKTVYLKQVAEMWIVEVEMAFTQLKDSMKCAEDCFKFLCRWILDNCSQDMKFVSKRIDKTVVHRLEYDINDYYDFPKAVKPFYVRMNDDEKTVAAFDLVVPKIGRVITGSQSEERLGMLTTRIKEFDLSRDQYEWYQDLRRHGTVKHSGFSLGFDLMVLLTTGLTDVRDAIPFHEVMAKPTTKKEPP
ncbi:putative Receptor-like protein kinase-related family protein [Hibiscus syriacus]|uniref:Receptor-like protein kinase-related family protein n=1 Tax=Hibiscus syriacus TaxID=106335 RepID=A0A6A3AYR8_HIBSY|nr:putative Receptor-like protein kinase-related family protein [Hibiscus syriacus]